MQIGLADIDSKIPNLALMKISAYHKSNNDNVEFFNPMFKYDKVYASKVFKYTPDNDYLPPDCSKGGSGYDLTTVLPDKIEKQKPDYDLYNCEYSLGFTTRGCIRNCKFCQVKQKEGNLKAVADIYDIWNGKHKDIVLLDNNILALPEHFKKICSQIRKENLRVDFNQGLDFRLLTDEICKELKTIKTINYRFAFDFPYLKKQVIEKCELLLKYKIRVFWYVLVGFESNFIEEFRRVLLLNKLRQRAFVMIYNNIKEKKYTALARWNNNPMWRNGISFKKFCDRNNYNYKEYFKPI